MDSRRPGPSHQDRVARMTPQQRETHQATLLLADLVDEQNDLLAAQNARLADQNQLLEEQNRLIEDQNRILRAAGPGGDTHCPAQPAAAPDTAATDPTPIPEGGTPEGDGNGGAPVQLREPDLPPADTTTEPEPGAVAEPAPAPPTATQRPAAAEKTAAAKKASKAAPAARRRTGGGKTGN